MKDVAVEKKAVPKRKAFYIAIAVLAAAISAVIMCCAAATLRIRDEREVKVRYDGQTYVGQGDVSDKYYGGHYELNGAQSAGGDYPGSIWDSAMDSEAVNKADAPAASAPSGDGFYDAEAIAGGKKLVYRYDYTVESESFDSFAGSLSSWLAGAGAYVERMSTDKKEYDTLDGVSRNSVRRSTYTIRVPADKAEMFRQFLYGDGAEVVYENASMSDRTEAYADADMRAASYRAEYARLEELIAQAESVTELIAIQDRLSSLNYSIQWQEKQKEIIDGDVAMSSVSLTLYEVLYYTASFTRYRYAIGERISDAFAGFFLNLPQFLFTMAYVAIGGFVVIGLGGVMCRVALNIRNKKARDQVVRLVHADPEGKATK